MQKRCPAEASVVRLERAVPNKNIFVYLNGEYDLSRWLTLSLRGSGICVVQLTDLCQPGRPSSLTSFTCPLAYLRSTVQKGVYQTTTGLGYAQLRSVGKVVQLEFKGFEDASATKVDLLAEDLAARLLSLEEEAARVAVPA